MDGGGGARYDPHMATMLSSPTLEMRAETLERLHAVAKLVGGDPLLIATEGIERLLDDLEDGHIAEERLRDHVPGTGIPIETLIAQCNLDN